MAVIPKELREELGIREGTRLRVWADKKRIIYETADLEQRQHPEFCNSIDLGLLLLGAQFGERQTETFQL